MVFEQDSDMIRAEISEGNGDSCCRQPSPQHYNVLNVMW